MIVREIRTYHVSLPLRRRLVSGIHDFVSVENILLEIDTGDAVGLGHAYAFTPGQANAIRELVVDLAETLVGLEAWPVRHHWAQLWKRINFIGHAGPPVMALAAVDTALWDLLAKAADLPLYRMLGSMRDVVPVYATGGWLSYRQEEVVEECMQYRDLGFRDYKMKVGHADWRVDVERVEYVTSHVGDDIRIMLDANQAWNASDAIAAGRLFAELGVVWYEEPVDVHDLEGSIRVAAEVDIPLAAGESLFTRHGMRPWIEQHALDVVMPDLMRCGGPTEFMHVASLADDRGLPISSHTFAEQSAHLVAAARNGMSVEIVPGWFDGLFNEPLVVESGAASLTDLPGLGLTLSERITSTRTGFGAVRGQ